jgi:hypothetical protein
MLFMVIETFPPGEVLPIYRRLAEKGRGLPEGVEVVESWISADLRRCFQLMRADDVALLQRWVLHWEGLGVAMEIVPVATSLETREMAYALMREGDAHA